MLVLFETSGGFAIFKVLKEKKLKKAENLYTEFEDPAKVGKFIQLLHFEKFSNMEEALKVTSNTANGKLSKKVKKCLKKFFDGEANEELAVGDPKLGASINEKMQISCVSNNSVQELMRCIRLHLQSFVEGLPERDQAAMSLGVAHGLSRYKFKFSPDKIDKMVIEAVSALDDVDKELNNYVMRCKEWYGWHFPELTKIVADNNQYIKIVQKMGFRENGAATDFSDFLSEDDERKVKEMAEISMGTDILEEDMENIQGMCAEVEAMQETRASLYEYLKNRMAAVAPNVTTLVGEMVGARLIAHAGSLMNLAKAPASTVQILGAEKALFRALKARHDTPKYGLIYHAQLIGQSSAAIRGKVSRMLAAKTSLAARVDALGEDEETDIGLQHRVRLERNLKRLEENKSHRVSGTGKSKAKFEKYENKSKVFQYKASADSTLEAGGSKGGKRRHSESHQDSPLAKKVKKEEVEDE